MAKAARKTRPAPPPKPKRVTIRDVAARAEVDVSLVSRVLNNHPKASASPTTRERILEAARTLGYQPNVVARGLRMARTWTLGLMLPNLTNPMYAEIIRAAELRARERGYGLVFGTHMDGEEDATFTRLLQQGRVDGLLTASGVHGDAFLRRVANGGFGPLVMINRRVRGVRPTVTLDDAAGAALAMEHFVELGHTAVAGIFGPSDIDTTTRRRVGFAAAGERAGLKPLLLDGDAVDAEAGAAVAARIFSEYPQTTAIFASTFAIGMGVLRAARRLGVAIPEHVSLVALHDSELAEFLTPSLTTVALPVDEMAHQAVDVLIALIDGAAPESVIVRTPPQLKLRGSTAKSRDVNRLTKPRRSA
ncbi:MAG TPA: LacI family DNA-binding transcriptional regulator [Bauldia sp.]|nr:LacI family DNA-binding transcriptional regulator [Bauldia sp.]